VDNHVDERLKLGIIMTLAKPLDLFDRLLGTSVASEQIQPGWRISLHAKNPPQNICRWYSIRVDKTLFGEWCLYLTYGRIGQRGQLKLSFWSDVNLLLRQLKAILRKRLNATKRIGCNYEIVEFVR
jgi:predicted DNA-binding WGR domain protein